MVRAATERPWMRSGDGPRRLPRQQERFQPMTCGLLWAPETKAVRTLRVSNIQFMAGT